MFKTSQRGSFLFVAALVLSVAGPVQSTALASPAGHGGFGMHEGGPGRFLFRALKELTLTDAQRAQVQQLQSAARARFKDLMDTLASQIEDGRINRVALQPKLDALKAGRADLERLHALLTPEQRAQLVDAAKAHLTGRGHRHGGHRWMGKLVSDLQLTDQQRAQVDQALRARLEGKRPAAQRAVARAGFTRLLEAFKSDRFVLSDLLPPKATSALAQRRSSQLGKGLEAVLPILTPQQRATLAQKIRARLAPPPAPGTEG
jgi:Spy/CpxP family protein refolding chaperone